jgi:DNA-binding transcriptional MocR family regulator
VSWQAVKWALYETPAEVKGPDLTALIILAEHAHDDGSEARPGIPTIARLARISERSVERALKRLEKAGLIRGKRRSGKATIWTLDMTPDTALSGVGDSDHRQSYDGPHPRHSSVGPPPTKRALTPDTALSDEPRTGDKPSATTDGGGVVDGDDVGRDGNANSSTKEAEDGYEELLKQGLPLSAILKLKRVTA